MEEPFQIFLDGLKYLKPASEEIKTDQAAYLYLVVGDCQANTITVHPDGLAPDYASLQTVETFKMGTS